MQLTPVRCYLIDDNYHDYEFFIRALKDLTTPVECIHYTSAEEALDRLNDSNQQLPHLIFVDINMPRMNGIDFLMQLKLTPHLADIPVYIHSSVENIAYVERTHELGVSGYLVKSPQKHELVNALQSILEQQQAQLQ